MFAPCASDMLSDTCHALSPLPTSPHMRQRFLLSRLAPLLTLVAIATPAFAQRVATRSDLYSVLGPTATTEDFEDVTFDGTSLFLRVPMLDASTSAPQFPAGRIATGLAFDNANNGHEFFAARPDIGLASRTYLAHSSEAEVMFTGGVRAVGLDMVARYFSNPQQGSVIFFGAGGQTIGQIDMRITEMVPAFFGWQSTGEDITRIRFSGFSTTGATTMHLDNLTFGPVTTTVTPEPATLALLAGGLVVVGAVTKRRKRV